MRYFAFACDYDGTIATLGSAAPETVAALKKLAASGRKLILVTGRLLDDLRQVFPEFGIFHRIVAENGAVLYRPDTKQAKRLGPAPPAEFISALLRENVQPLSIGESIVATTQPHDRLILKLIRQFGLELEIIYNKESVMVLPSGVNKSTGLNVALTELGISNHNVVSVGDAENDHTLLQACECGVTLANAIPALKENADLVMDEANGKGVQELIATILENDLENVPARNDRKIVLGKSTRREDVFIQPYGASLLIAGPSGSGKSTVVHALLERLLEKEYEFCLIDPEGDYDDAENTLALGSPFTAPEIKEIIKALEKPKTSLIVNLLAVPVSDRPQFFAELFPRIQDLRSRTGRPHWIIIDEAHHLLPASGDGSGSAIALPLRETMLITVHADKVSRTAIGSCNAIVAVGSSPYETIRQFGAALGVNELSFRERPSKPGDVLVWFVGASEPIHVHVQPAATDALRHKRKYAEGRLGEDRSFFFRGPQDKLNLRAHNLMMFNEIAQGVDDETWLFHLRQSDYSTWIREAIKDEDLASETRDIENRLKSDPKASRQEIAEAINRRYTASE